ncbi:POL5 protein, partial [Pseudoatta argentina]
MIQKQGHWVPYELKPRDVERRFGTCELLLQRQKKKIEIDNIEDSLVKHEIKDLIENYKPQKIKETKVKMNIVLKDEIPVYQRPRRLAPAERVQVSKQIDDWLRDGIIRPSISEYASPITLRKNIMSRDVSMFDDCNLSNVKLYLNSAFYPYNDLNLDFGKKRYAVLFDMYARFHRTYYGSGCFETLFNVLSFIEKEPFVVIDCSRQKESVKSVTVDVRIEFDCKENVPQIQLLPIVLSYTIA